MGFRFRKSVKLGPFRLTASKSGLSWSVGTKAARLTKTSKGKTRATFSIPGTGIRPCLKKRSSSAKSTEWQ